MLSRPHQRHGWLHLAAGDWRACLDRQIQERDKLNDRSFSGPPPEWCRWVDEQQMPQLARQPHYRRQFDDRITELQMQLANLEQQIAGGRLDLEPAAGICRLEIKQLEALIHG